MQQQQSSTYQQTMLHPRTFDVFFHILKTGKLIIALLTDGRISLIRKGFFIGSLGFLLVLLIFPDILGEFVISTLLPLIGTVMGIPLDAGFDWVAFALAIVSLLHVFPAELVTEHYLRIFRQR
jgi:hypothetical protein